MLDSVVSILSPAQKKTLDVSLTDEDVVTGFTGLRVDPGDANLDNILLVAKRLSFVRSLDLPDTLLAKMGEPVARTFRRRAANETPWRMRQHPEGRRHALYAIFLAHRKREITDGLVDLLVDVVHKIRGQAKHMTVKRLSQEIDASTARKRFWSGSPRRQPALPTAPCARLFSRRSGRTCFPRSSANTRHLVHLSGGCIRCCALPKPAITGACCRLVQEAAISLIELLATGPAPKTAVIPRRTLPPFRNLRRVTFRTPHLRNPPPGARWDAKPVRTSQTSLARAMTEPGIPSSSGAARKENVI